LSGNQVRNVPMDEWTWVKLTAPLPSSRGIQIVKYLVLDGSVQVSFNYMKVWKKSLKKNLNVDDNWKCDCYISPLATFVTGKTKKIKTKMLYVWHMTLFGCQWTSNPRFLNLKDLTAHMQVISNNFKPTFFQFRKQMWERL
jgi:hypothetical protein